MYPLLIVPAFFLKFKLYCLSFLEENKKAEIMSI